MMSASDAPHEKGLRARRDVLLANGAAIPFDERSEEMLVQLSSSWSSLALQLRSVLRKTPSKLGIMNAQALAPTARRILLEAVFYCCRARNDLGLETNPMAELDTPGTILATENRMKPKDGARRIQSASASMWLKELRKLLIFDQGVCDPLIGERQRDFAAQPKQSKDHRVFLIEEYVVGAMAISAFAQALIEAGYASGKTLSRDAALLAADSCLLGRRGELHRANCSDFHHRTIAGKPALSAVLRETKTHREKSVLIRDQRVIDLVAPLVTEDEAAPLFRNDYGDRLSASGVARILERIAELAVGERGGANIMRCSPGKRSDGRKKDVTSLLNHKNRKTGDSHYSPDQADLNLRLIVTAAKNTANARRANTR